MLTLVKTTQEAIKQVATALWGEARVIHGATASLVYGMTEMRVSWCDEHNAYHFLFEVSGEPCGLADIDSAASLAVLISAVVNVDMMVCMLAEALDNIHVSDIRSMLDAIKKN